MRQIKMTVDGEVYEFDGDRITNVEGMAIERVTGMTFVEWNEALQRGSMLAQTALIWVVKKRVEPTLRFDDVVYAELQVEQVGGDDAAPLADAVEPEASTTTA